MTLTELRYAIVLSQTQHFGQAAKRCCVSQPTLSIAIKKFEAELGVEIFAQCHKVLDELAIIKDITADEGNRLCSPPSYWCYLHH